MKLPPEIDDCGATLDNCGNWIAFMRQSMLDDLVDSLESGDFKHGLALVKEVKKEFLRQAMDEYRDIGP